MLKVIKGGLGLSLLSSAVWEWLTDYAYVKTKPCQLIMNVTKQKHAN
jgi:hypothetical protein